MNNEELNNTPVTGDTYKSPSIAKLAKALSQVQGNLKAAVKDSNNPFFKSKYADLTSVWDAIRDDLSKNGLAVVQLTTGDAALPGVKTVLMHESGEFIESTLYMKPVKADPQGIGSCITYMRRYSLSAIVGVVQDDDDANEASAPASKSSFRSKPYAKKA